MDLADTLRLIVLLASTGVSLSLELASGTFNPWLQVNSTNVNQFPASSVKKRTFSNQFLTIAILPDWTARPVNQTLDIIHGKYILSINPIFTHASGIIGGRFSEIVAGMPSVNAVMSNVDQPAGGWECSQTDRMIISNSISLANLYTDKLKTGNGCTFPYDSQPAWFGSSVAGQESESDYTITLS